MITLLKHGVFIHTDAEGSIVQSAEIENKKEESTVSGMVGAKTQIVRVFDHSESNAFSVTGKGDLTFETGVGADPQLTGLTGGVFSIPTFKYSQKIGEPSEWSYSGTHYPYASS